MDAARAAGARHFVLLSAFCVRSAELRHDYALQVRGGERRGARARGFALARAAARVLLRAVLPRALSLTPRRSPARSGSSSTRRWTWRPRSPRRRPRAAG